MHFRNQILLRIITRPHSISPVKLQYKHLIPSPVDRTSASAWLYKHLWITYQKHKPSTTMTHVASELKLRSIERLFMHPCQETGWQFGVWSCIMPGLPRYLVQELNAGTVHVWWFPLREYYNKLRHKLLEGFSMKKSNWPLRKSQYLDKFDFENVN